MAPPQHDEEEHQHDDDDDDDEMMMHAEQSIHRFRGNQTWTASITAGAFQMHGGPTEQETAVTRSIGGRLGGQMGDRPLIDALRTTQQQQQQHVAGEGTPLVDKEKQQAAFAPPPLTAWIVPALLCAASHAFYNIFIKKGSADIHPILGGVVVRYCMSTCVLSFQDSRCTE